MKNGRVLAAVAAILVLGGGSVAFVLWREADQAEESRRQLLATVDAELSGGERDGLRDALRRVVEARRDDDARDLVIAQAELLLALGREREAWETIELAAITPGAPPEVLEVGARVLARLHASTAEPDVGGQALGMATRHARATGSTASLFLAWRTAWRLGDVDAFVELHEQLVTDSGEALEAATARALSGAMVGLLATRFGLPLEPAVLESASAGTGPRATLARLAIDTEAAASVAELGSLQELRGRWDSPPAELDIAIANAAIRNVGEISGELAPEQRDALQDALRRIEAVLETWPASVDARHAAVVALFGLGEVHGVKGQGHVRWLLQNAPRDDLRRETWKALRAG